MTLPMFDPVGNPSVKVRRTPWQSEVDAANKATLGSGAMRTWAFQRIRDWGSATSVELAYAWAEEHPCHCGCTHVPPVPVNQWGARLLELREQGVVAILFEDGEAVSRSLHGRSANVHVLTRSGWREARRA